MRPPDLRAVVALLLGVAVASAGLAVLVVQERADRPASSTPPPAPASASASRGVSPEPGPAATGHGPGPLSEGQLLSAPVEACGRSGVHLTGGHLEGAGRLPAVDVEDVLLADLDGDDAQEGVLRVACTQGNSVRVAVLVYRAGPRLLGRVPVEEGLPDQVQGQTVRTVSGRLEVSGSFRAADEPSCCPTGVVVRQYRVRGDDVVRTPAPGLDEGEPLTGGDGWSTVRVGATYDELARDTGLPVVLDVLEDGEPGRAACALVDLGASAPAYAVGGGGRVRAVVVTSPAVRTGAGVHVGTEEADVLRAYAGRVVRVPDPYGGVPDAVLPAGDGRVVRFEFGVDGTVSSIHAGEEGYASLVEGCA